MRQNDFRKQFYGYPILESLEERHVGLLVVAVSRWRGWRRGRWGVI